MIHFDFETDQMTQESLFDALVYADIPSRTVLTSVLQDGLLKKSIFASNAFIYHFDDIRDGIDLVLKNIRGSGNNCGDKHDFNWISTFEKGTKATAPSTTSVTPLFFHLNSSIFNSSSDCLKMNELFDSEEVRFACSRASEDLLNSRRDGKQALLLPSATILISLDFLGGSQVPFESVDGLVLKIKELLYEYGGPILASSEVKRNLRTGCNFKFFAEFYRISDCKSFLQICDKIGGIVLSDNQNVQVSFEGVNLYDIDREALFFSEHDSDVDADVEVEAMKCTSNMDKRRKDSISSIEGKYNGYFYCVLRVCRLCN